MYFLWLEKSNYQIKEIITIKVPISRSEFICWRGERERERNNINIFVLQLSIGKNYQEKYPTSLSRTTIFIMIVDSKIQSTNIFLCVRGLGKDNATDFPALPFI